MNDDVHERICVAPGEDVVIEQNQDVGRWVTDAGQAIVTEDLQETLAYTVYAFPGAELKYQGQPAEVLSTDDPDEVVQHLEENE